MKTITKNKRYSFILTHFRREANYLLTAIATETLVCDVCHYPILNEETYWYPATKAAEDLPRYICFRCKHMFQSLAIPNKPYWLTKPNIGATSNIRTEDDKGIREFLDGTYEEWNEIWDHDKAGSRFP